MELHDVSLYACSFASPSRRDKSYTRACPVFKANFESRALYIRPLHISHNAPYLPPKILHNLVFNFSWALHPFQEKLKTMLMQKNWEGGGEGGGEGRYEVHYGR